MITLPWIQQLGWTLLHFLWQGLLLASILAVVLVCLQRRSASTRYLVRCTGLLLMGVCPILTWGMLAVPAPPSHGPESHQHDTLVSAAGDVEAIPLSLGDQLMAGFVALWALGALWFLARLLVGVREVRRLQRPTESPMPAAWQRRFQGLCAAFQVNVTARLTRSKEVAVPVVVGWLRPVVLLPARLVSGMTEEQVAALLAHELAHVRRHDALVNLWQSLMESIFFYHPAIWWVSQGIRVEREFCCDDMAVAAMGRALPYARALATLESIRGAELRLAPSSRGGPLMLRVQRLVGDRGATDRGFLLRSLPAAVGLLLMGVLGATAWASSADPMGDDENKTQRRIVLTLQTGEDGRPVLVQSVTRGDGNGDVCPECGHRTQQAPKDNVLRGRVVDPRGQPVQDALVRWVQNRPVAIDPAVHQVDMDEDGELDLWVTSTDAVGRFEWNAVNEWTREAAGGGAGEDEAKVQWVIRNTPVLEWVQELEAVELECLDEPRTEVLELECVLDDDALLQVEELDLELVDPRLSGEPVLDVLLIDPAAQDEVTLDLLVQDGKVKREGQPTLKDVWHTPQANVVIDRLDPELSAVLEEENAFVHRIHVVTDDQGRPTSNFVLEEDPGPRTAQVHVQNVLERLTGDGAQTYKIELKGEVTLTPTGIQANEITFTDLSRVVEQPVIESRVKLIPPQLRQGEYRVRLQARETVGPDGQVILDVVPVMEADVVVPKPEQKSEKADRTKVRRISM